MTWKELQAHTQVMDEQQLNSEVNIRTSNDDYFLVAALELSSNGVGGLEINQPYLEIEIQIPTEQE